jgi:hypothetical protein
LRKYLEEEEENEIWMIIVLLSKAFPLYIIKGYDKLFFVGHFSDVLVVLSVAENFCPLDDITNTWFL